MNNSRMSKLMEDDKDNSVGDNRFKKSLAGRQAPVLVKAAGIKRNVVELSDDEEEGFSGKGEELLSTTRKNFWVNRATKNMMARASYPKKKISLSSYGKTSGAGDEPWTFQVDLADRIKDVKAIRFVSANIEYTVPGSIPAIPKMGLIYFENFPSAGNKQYETASDGTKYHSIFPVLTGGTGTTVNFLYEFPDFYQTEIYNSKNVIDTLYVRIFKEDPVTNPGSFIPFSDITYISIEVELTILRE